MRPIGIDHFAGAGDLSLGFEQVGLSETEELIFYFTTDRKKSTHPTNDQYKVSTAWRKYVEEKHRP